MLAIFKKEMRGYFQSLLGYLFLAFYFIFLGIFLYSYNLKLEYANVAYAINSVARFFLLLIPMLTMRVFAEERRQKTDQLLLTAPISYSKVVLGKYLALVGVMALAALGTCIYPFILRRYGDTSLKIAFSTLAAFFLLGCTYMAIGMFLSSLTESQVVAAVLTFIVILFTWIVDLLGAMLPTDAKTALLVWSIVAILLGIVLYRLMHSKLVSCISFGVVEAVLLIIYFGKSEMLDGSVGNVFGWFSLLTRFENFKYGLFDPAAFIYYLSMMVLFVFLTIQVLNKRRWSQ